MKPQIKTNGVPNKTSARRKTRVPNERIICVQLEGSGMGQIPLDIS